MWTSTRTSTPCNASQTIISHTFLMSAVVCCPLVLRVSWLKAVPNQRTLFRTNKLPILLSDLQGVQSSFAPCRETRRCKSVREGGSP